MCIRDRLEGDEGHKHLAEYADAKTERGQCMLKSICDKMGFDSLGFQSVHLTGSLWEARRRASRAVASETPAISNLSLIHI